MQRISLIAAMLCLGTVFFSACTNKEASTEAESLNAGEVVNNPSTATGQEEAKGSAVLTVDQSTFDFGEAVTGEPIAHRFTFRNSGDAPLIISDAKASCGCTVPSWTQKPIAPGDTGSVYAVFNTEGKAGPQNKTITLTTNANPSSSILLITGTLKGIPDKGPLAK